MGERLEGDSIGSVLWVQVIGDISPVPMKIFTVDGRLFSGMWMYIGFEQVRKDESGCPVEILFLALGDRGESGFFRWLKPGEKAQFSPPVDYYDVGEILWLSIGYKGGF